MGSRFVVFGARLRFDTEIRTATLRIVVEGIKKNRFLCGVAAAVSCE
jgi:hypothetical protein